MSEREIHLDESCLIEPEPDEPDYGSALRLLNMLYAVESRSFFRYLETWEPYTDPSLIKLWAYARKLVKASYDHADRLAHAIESLGGVAIIGAFAKEDAHANFTDWPNLLARLIETKSDLIARHNAVLSSLSTGASEALDRVIAELRTLNDENHEHLRELKSWAERLK